MTYRHPLAWLLGLEGVALLRATAGDGFDRAFVAARIAEVRDLLDQRVAPFTDDGEVAGRIGTVDGYREWAPTYDNGENPLIHVEEPVVRRILDGLPAGDALDAACGTGRHARYLVSRGHRVIGVDSSPDMLAVARSGLPGIEFRDGDLRRLPVPDAAFDVVVCGLAVAHVPDLPGVMAEFARVLRTGGHLVVSDIHVLSLYLGGVGEVPGPDGSALLLPASRYFASDYLSAALPVGLRVLGCAEPRWPVDGSAGGPLARQWCPAAADAAYTGTPAAIIWHFQRA